MEENGVHVKQKKKGTISQKTQEIEIKKIIPTFFLFFIFYFLDSIFYTSIYKI